jgi:hypothetical protein
MPEPNTNSGMPRNVVEAVFTDFVSRMEKDGSIEAITVQRIRDALSAKQLSVEKLKAVLFSEDRL